MADDYRVQSELVMGRLAREALLEMAEELEREAAMRARSDASASQKGDCCGNRFSIGVPAT